jgi:fused signal recognition particle receptor
MFGFLKQKLKDAVSVFTKKVDEEAKPVEAPVVEAKPEVKKIPEQKPEHKPEQKSESKPAFKSEPKPEPKKETVVPKAVVKPEVKKAIEPKVETKPVPKQEPISEPKFSQLFNCDKCGAITDEFEFKQNGWTEADDSGAITYLCKNCQPKKGFFSKIKEAITTKKLDPTQFDELFWDLELVLLENNVAVEVIDKIRADLKIVLVDHPIPRGKIEETISASLKNSISGLFNIEKVDVISNIKKKKDKPYIICFFGVNGSGKTTTIAKFARLLYNNKLSAVFAASDTFRAAAIQQLEEHAVNLGVKIIKHDYGSDSAAVAFDAVKYAQAHNVDVVLIDTAGRMHSNTNLMDELKKIIKVVKPDIKIFVGESITGNDCIEQAQVYDKEIGIDGIILTKADVDDKGGAAISISYVTKKPILYMGMGQKYDDLKPFDKNELVNALGL